MKKLCILLIVCLLGCSNSPSKAEENWNYLFKEKRFSLGYVGGSGTNLMYSNNRVKLLTDKGVIEIVYNSDDEVKRIEYSRKSIAGSQTYDINIETGYDPELNDKQKLLKEEYESLLKEWNMTQQDLIDAFKWYSDVGSRKEQLDI